MPFVFKKSVWIQQGRFIQECCFDSICGFDSRKQNTLKNTCKIPYSANKLIDWYFETNKCNYWHSLRCPHFQFSKYCQCPDRKFNSSKF